LASDLLVQKVEVSPQKQVKDKYAQKFLQYKDLVEVEYTANYIDSEALVKVIKDPAGLYFVHFAIEPGRLSVNQYEDKYSTTLRVNGSVLNQESKTIYQFERVISLDFDREKMLTISHQPLNIHDMFPLIPGTYRLSILVKNEASKEFTTLEQNIAVPQDETAARMSSLILGYHVTRTEDKEGRLKPFRLGSFQVYAQPNRVFLKKDLLAVAFQMTNLTSVEKAKGEVDFKFFKEDQEFRSFSRKVSEYPELPNCLEEFSLAEFSPAHYKIQASLLVNGQEVLSGRDEFDVTYQEQMARPWVSSRSLPNPDDPIYDYLVGSQFFNGGKMEEAQQNLEKAYQKKPDSMEIALSLAQVDMARAENAKVEALLLPFFSQAQPPKYELFIALGKAYQSLGQLSKAVDVYDKAISHYGINLNLLNNLGECYFRLGNAKEALRAWEKSLEINPNQPQVKKYVEALKEKK
jgi:tetratricopeptide (TPR) repeat protein